MMANLGRRILTIAILTAQPPPPPPPLESYAYNNPIGVSPAMIIIFVSIVATFFLMGCLSVYANRCVDYGIDVSGGTTTTSVWQPSVDGLDLATIASFPAFVYSEVKELALGKGALECAVCLSEFEDADTLRLLPKCCHVFHQDCIDTWLFANVTCPVCRAMLIPRPGETPSFVLPVREPEHSYHAAEEDDIVIEIQSPGLTDSGHTAQLAEHPVAPRSTSRKNRLFGKFKRSFTTGHVEVKPVKPDDDYSRFTLRLPEEVRSMLVSRSVGQAKTCGAVFPRVMSQKNGFRSSSVGPTNERSLMNYERFEPEGRPDRWRFTRTLSVFSPTGSIRSPNWIVGDVIQAKHVGNVSMSLSRSAKSSFQFGADDSIKEDVNVGERSFDRLRFEGNEI